MTSRAKLVITDTVFPDLELEQSMLGDVADIVLAPPGDPGRLAELLTGAHAVLNCYAVLPPEVVDDMKHCLVICRTGIGLDTIPLDVATRRGIMVANVPDYCISEVADHTAALALSLLRRIDVSATHVRQGRWDYKLAGEVRRLGELSVGLVGFGRIARAFGSRMAAFGMKVRAHDPFVAQDSIREAGAEPVSLDQLFGECDVISLHAPLAPSTRHMVNEARLALMKPGAILLNSSRGGLVDFKALTAALVEGRIAGAGLDVLEQEPPVDMPDGIPNLIVTPHLAFYSREAMGELRRSAAAEIRRVLDGRVPKNWVNRASREVA
ncbi:MAG: C-terminal binding protein [Pseudomonadota bacterium]